MFKFPVTAARPVRMQEEGEASSFFLLLGIFFLFAGPAAELWVAAAVMEASRQGGREAEARRINFSDAQL